MSLDILTLAAPLENLLLWAFGYFLAIYLSFALLAWIIASLADRPICQRSVTLGQIRGELLRSLRSILLFGAGIAVPWAMVQVGLAGVDAGADVQKVVLDCALLVFWNDLHFYAVHRLLHAWLARAHAVHHKSVAATPFAAYSMSVSEAVLLGSVMPLAMLLREFAWQALLFLPIWSIFINTLSHSNCDLFPRVGQRSILGFIRHHQSHHTHYRGNYGFFFCHLDRIFGTERPFDRQETS